MPVYGQPTEFNERLCSLMSAIFCNSNDLYDGHHYPTTTSRLPTATHTNTGLYRPLFTQAMLRKAATLEGMQRPQFPAIATTTAAAAATTTIIIEVVLVVATVDDNYTCQILTKLISQFFALPEDGNNNINNNNNDCRHHLKVITVRSQSIR